MLQPAFPYRLFTMRTQKRPIVYFQFPWPEWIHIAAAPGTIPFCHPSSPLPALWGLLYAMLYGIASRSYFFSLTLFLALFKEPYISGGSEMSPFSIILFYFVAFKTRILWKPLKISIRVIYYKYWKAWQFPMYRGGWRWQSKNYKIFYSFFCCCIRRHNWLIFVSG